MKSRVLICASLLMLALSGVAQGDDGLSARIMKQSIWRPDGVQILVVAREKVPGDPEIVIQLDETVDLMFTSPTAENLKMRFRKRGRVQHHDVTCSRQGHDRSLLYEFAVVAAPFTERFCLSRAIGLFTLSRSIHVNRWMRDGGGGGTIYQSGVDLEQILTRHMMTLPDWRPPWATTALYIFEHRPGGNDFGILPAVNITVEQIGSRNRPHGEATLASTFPVRLRDQRDGTLMEVNCRRDGHAGDKHYEFAIMYTFNHGLVCLSRLQGYVAPRSEPSGSSGAEVTLKDCDTDAIEIAIRRITAETAAVRATCYPSQWVTYRDQHQSHRPLTIESAAVPLHDGVLSFEWNGQVITCEPSTGIYALGAAGCTGGQ